ncbi:hypothetical protein IEE92_13350 [Kocuria sp. cx-116]|uniref:hypothetical protein n=1 Tax=Kocuria sp. cx-116 TaxID=2771378 RepID=UPI001683388C|nr:hypothetical protein [Kocuria sp. cx-116]MBD2763514.1 hypothetical protein [Kocuria sp. cx-116]
MDTPTQLATQIRFHLENLGESNAHHPFEQLCLGLTRRRIVSNVMPATGPVSGGGDDGRDGESFWTAIADELPNTSLFAALATDQQVVLAVTAQRENVPPKIRGDLAKICDKGSPVDRIVYFTITAVTVSKRHELQAHARENYSVALDIWDAQAISEQLSSHDLFYLAVDYLHVPSSLTPERPVEAVVLPDWYLAVREHWRGQSSCAGTTGELVDLREGLRFSSLNDDARADLPDWLAAAYRLREACSDNLEVLSRIEYEIVIATGFGMNTLRPVDAVLRSYFGRHATRPPDSGVLMDAMTLLRLIEAMQLRRLTAISVADCSAWHVALEETVDSMLTDAEGPNARAHLLSVAAMLAHGPRAMTEEELAGAAPSEAPLMSEIYRALSEAKRYGRPLPSAPVGGGFRDLDKSMACLSELAGLLPSTPLVPIDQLTTMFDITAPLLVDHHNYVKVRQAFDDATVERSGKAAAGDRAQARAVAFLDADRPIQALREIHAAKMNWLYGESAEGAAIMMLLAARVYEELGLPVAAKQYAMSAAAVARESDDPALAALMAQGFILAATYEHKAGQWLTATQTFRIGIWAQAQLAGNPWSFERYPYFLNMLIDQCFIVRTAKSLRPDFLPLIEPVIESTNLNEMLDPMLAEADSIPALGELEVAESADRSGMGRPFSDAGPTRRYTWSALGNLWTVRGPNNRVHVLAAERFVAAAQIALADLVGEDLLLIAGPIDIEVAVSDGPVKQGDVFVDKSKRESAAHLIRLTATEILPLDAGQLEVISAVMQAIATHSLLGRAAFVAVMERTFDRGLPHMLTCVRPYDELVDVHRESFFENLRGLEETFIGPDVPSAPHQASGLTQSFTAPVAGYDAAASLQAIRNRYEQLLPPVRLTVRRLAHDDTFMAVAEELRAQGWKDWHLLTAVVNIVVNARAVACGINMTTSITQADITRFQALMGAEELPTDPETPVHKFSSDSMWFHLANAARSTAQAWGLEARINPIEPQAFLEVLGARFNYWSDDVEHEPIFEP